MAVAALAGEETAKSFSPSACAAAREASASSAAFAIRFSRPIFWMYSSAACRLMISVVAGV